MRIHLLLTKNESIIPFNYQHMLTGVLHKWIGKNSEHDKTSLYSFSWLKNGDKGKDGFNFRNGGKWFISAQDPGLIKRIIKGIQDDPTLFHGMSVKEITLQQDPAFGDSERFLVASPIFIKRRQDDGIKFYYYNDSEADKLLTESLQHKLTIAGLNPEGVKVEFDKDFSNPSIKAITYNKITSKGSVCPVIIKGTPEQIAFAWNVGLGNSTGIGFGSLN